VKYYYLKHLLSVWSVVADQSPSENRGFLSRFSQIGFTLDMVQVFELKGSSLLPCGCPASWLTAMSVSEMDCKSKQFSRYTAKLKFTDRTKIERLSFALFGRLQGCPEE